VEAFERRCEDLDNDVTGQSLLTTIVTDEGAVYAVYSDRTLHDERAVAALQTAPPGESAVAAGISTAPLPPAMTASACQPEHPVAWPNTAESVLPIKGTVARPGCALQAGLPLSIAARGSLHSSITDALEEKWFDRIFEAEPGSGQPIHQSSMKRYCD
jgi:hypothetical protein